MKPALLVAYFGLVAIGGISILIRSRRAFEYIAQRDLPPNHRLLASDLRTPNLAWALEPALPEKSDYTGRYLDRRIRAGEPVRREYLRAQPALLAAQGTESYTWFLKDSEKQWLQVLDVGWTLDLCADTCPVMGAPVLALNCSSPNSQACAVVLQLTSDQKRALLAYPGKSKLSITVSAVDFGGGS